MSQSCSKFKCLVPHHETNIQTRARQCFEAFGAKTQEFTQVRIIFRSWCRDLHRVENVLAMHCRLPRSKARGLAQVGKYRSTGYVWRQSHYNLRRVRCTGSWGTIHAHSSFAVRQSVNFPLASKVRRKQIHTRRSLSWSRYPHPGWKRPFNRDPSRAILKIPGRLRVFNEFVELTWKSKLDHPNVRT